MTKVIKKDDLLTKSETWDNYLLYFLDFKTLGVYAKLSKSTNSLIKAQGFYKQLCRIPVIKKPHFVCEWIAKENHNELLVFLMKKKFSFKIGEGILYCVLPRQCMFIAAQYGNLQIIKTLNDRHKLDRFAIIRGACAGGRVDILEWCFNGFRFDIDHDLQESELHEVSLKYYPMYRFEELPRKHLQKLICDDEHFEKSLEDPSIITDAKEKILYKRFLCYYNERCIDLAIENNKICILDWFKKKGIQIKYNPDSINQALQQGNFDIIKWFEANNIKIKFNSEYILGDLARIGRIDMLDWLKNSGLHVFVGYVRIGWTNRGGGYPISAAAAMGHVHVLDWFETSPYQFVYDEDAIDGAAGNGEIEVLKWFDNRPDLLFKYSEHAVDWASMNGHDYILEWFKNSRYPFKYQNAINFAIEYRQAKIIIWFKNNYHLVHDSDKKVMDLLIKRLNNTDYSNKL